MAFVTQNELQLQLSEVLFCRTDFSAILRSRWFLTFDENLVSRREFLKQKEEDMTLKGMGP